MPFFNAWEFHGRFPEILKDKVVGKPAGALYSDAQRLLDQIIKDIKLVKKNGTLRNN